VIPIVALRETYPGLHVLHARLQGGMLNKARRGELPNFTGVSDPYEAPVHPEVTVNTERETIDESVAKILNALESRGYVPAAANAA